ncbi:Flp pilus assembly complex ATPase component TadA (plasmid) [Burkholderia vietnamiensis]|uniref:Type II secretion system protein E n=1 Tax=Burkholderia vietnamiensis (strain G4 / LMG 22486) TaxID=269482 RepID=A4JVH0_BURVG|nr:type II secretion system protein E [Burkholderia vietnamiensis G4]MCB4349461.1 Flp pilus assembly complex ATPase component TadA [Burkholderia vietnamiensis]
MKISEAEFADLYIGEDFADVAGLNGMDKDELIPVPAQFDDEIVQLRAQCFKIIADQPVGEFSLRKGNVLLRVTCLPSTDGKDVFVIRKPMAKLLDREEIGLGKSDLEYLMRPELRGLVLFVGEMRSGKTTRAASFVKARLETHGGTAIAIEDPPETALDGMHGRGRCIQVDARGSGAYQEQLKRSVRTGAGMIYLGEVRDGETAMQVVSACNNGHLILSTTHALSVQDAIMRICNFCAGKLEDPEKALASGLAVVVHLKLFSKWVNSATGPKEVKRVEYTMLRVEGNKQVQGLIRTKQFHLIDNAVEEQQAKQRSGSF